MIIRVYRALDPEGTEVQLISMVEHKPGETEEGLDGILYTIIESREEISCAT